MDHLTAAGFAGMTIGAVDVGIAVVLLISLHPTRTNVSISLIFLCLGLSLFFGIPLVDQVDPDHPGWWPRVSGVVTVGLLASSASYMAALLDTTQPRPARLRWIRAVIRVCYVTAGVAGLIMVLFPAEVFNDIVFSITEPGFFTASVTWSLGTVYALGGALYMTSWLVIARQRLDVGERTRAICAALIVVAITCATVIPLPAAVGVLAVALLIGLYGQFRYFVEQGERGAFLSRFLSSQVAESVRAEGLTAVMQPGEREVTVVACDLRGFTSYAEAVPSRSVIDLLAEYYEAVGAAVAEVGGTVKDYAGDGVLIVIGAPLPRDDHAAAALILARRLHEVVTPVRDHWGTGPHPLGMGVGVATGRVAVGAVGSSARMEYTVVGTAVNIAARLCSAAVAGETLIDEGTVALTGVDGLLTRGPMPIKGLSADHVVYAVEPVATG